MLHGVTSFLRDLRYSLRLFAKNPGPYAVAVLSLGLAIGPNTFLFSVLDAMFLRPWPVPRAEQLYNMALVKQARLERVPYSDYLDYQRGAALASEMAVWGSGGALLTVGGGTEMVSSNSVSSNYFSVLGLTPYSGRFFGPADEKYFQTEPPVVLSYDFWRRQFGGDQKVLGRRISLNERRFTVVGIAPPDFNGLQWILPADMWMPVEAWNQRQQLLTDRGKGGYNVVVRPRPGVTQEQAATVLNSVARGLEEAYPDTNRGKRVSLASESDDRGKRAAGISAVVLSLVGLVLLVACANVAGLLLSQAEARRRETAVRLAIGASRAQLVRQLLAESLLLSLMAAGLGCALAYWLITLIPVFKPPIPFPLNWDIRINAAALMYTLGLSVITAVIFGLAPALQTTKSDLTAALKGLEPQSRRGRLRITLRGTMVVSQILVSVCFLYVAGLLVRSYLKTGDAPVGFDTRKPILLVWAGVPSREDLQKVADRLGSLPGVRRASYSRHFAMNGFSGGGAARKILIPGTQPPPGSPPESVRYNVVGLRYFDTMGTRLLRGRTFEPADGPDSGKVVIINQTMARRYWPGQEALDRQFEAEGIPYQVVGIVEDGKYNSLREAPQAFMFFSGAQNSFGEGYFLLETAVPPASLAGVARQAAVAAAPGLKVLSTVTLVEQMRVARYAEELSSRLFGAVALLAVFLSSVGLFGVVATIMGRRRREFGIRMALGATRWNVMRIVYGYGLRMVGIGSVLGLATAYAAMFVLASVLYEVQPGDPLTLAGVCALVALITLAACHFPAMQATRADPANCLRSE
jgi:predicted permease